MISLSDLFSQPERHERALQGCLDLLDSEVASKSGLSGLAIKGGYKLVSSVKPGFLRQLVADLLPEFAAALQPLWSQAQAEGRSAQAHFSQAGGQVASALLAITDKRAEHTKLGALKATYGKLRPSASRHVEAAAPALGGLIDNLVREA